MNIHFLRQITIPYRSAYQKLVVTELL
jgi:hypothetical protein